YLTTEELQHGVAVDAVVEVAAMPAARVEGQALAESATQEAQVARAEDQVVGIVHHGNLVAALEVVLQGIQADLIVHLQQAAAIVSGAPVGQQLLDDVAVEVALQGPLEERGEAGALADRVVRRGDQAAAVDQVGSEGHVRDGKTERAADQHGQLLVAELLPRALEVVEDGFVEIDTAFFLEVARKFAENQLKVACVVVHAPDPGLHQAIEVGHRGVQVDRRVEHQHSFEVEAAQALVQFADEGGVESAEAVAGEVVVAYLQSRMLGTHGHHDPVQVFGVGP